MKESPIRMAINDLFKKKTPPRTVRLHTPWMDQPEVPWNEYPRPQLKRNSFLCLNGKWELRCNGESWGEILVPYPVESQLSGIERQLQTGDILTYERSFALPAGFMRDRVILHFGAVDQECTVFVNGRELGSHVGGYLPFSFDITDVLTEGENTIMVQVRDDLDHDRPWGKQSKTRGGMWYTPVSGIWQTVWLESVPEAYIQSLRISTDMEEATIEISGGCENMVIECEGKQYPIVNGRAVIRPEAPKLWTPETPHLYHFTVLAGADRVESYFALRSITTGMIDGVPKLLLNGKPYFLHGLLDQGYWPDGIFLPGAPEGITWDVATMKELGFNMLRKHIKVEPERFYYDCDRLGLVVFQDLINSGDYYYLRDTALPTVGFQKDTYHPKPSARRAEFFVKHGEELVKHLHNHPSVLLYTLFNEGWGQHDTQNLYEHFKSLAPDRVWNAASGWFKNSDNDLQSEHIYFGSLDMKPLGKRPLALTEFGGYSWPVTGHRFNLDEEYGYRKYQSSAELQEALSKLYLEDILPQLRKNGLCITVLTQVSDVEDETNGLVTYDRQLIKVDPAQMRAIAAALKMG